MRYALWGKIFGVGLSRTGTVSLTEALNALGYRILHYQRPDLAVSEKRLWWLYFWNDGGTDNTVSAVFERLDRLFPNSRFIYMERDLEPWLASLERHYANRGDDVAPIELELRVKMFGTDAFDPVRLRQAYRDHHDRVLNYFAHRSARLLRLRVCDGEGWEKLCPFIGKEIPAIPFPHAHRTGPA